MLFASAPSYSYHRHKFKSSLCARTEGHYSGQASNITLGSKHSARIVSVAEVFFRNFSWHAQVWTKGVEQAGTDRGKLLPTMYECHLSAVTYYKFSLPKLLQEEAIKYAYMRCTMTLFRFIHTHHTHTHGNFRSKHHRHTCRRLNGRYQSSWVCALVAVRIVIKYECCCCECWWWWLRFIFVATGFWIDNECVHNLYKYFEIRWNTMRWRWIELVLYIFFFFCFSISKFVFLVGLCDQDHKAA